ARLSTHVRAPGRRHRQAEAHPYASAGGARDRVAGQDLEDRVGDLELVHAARQRPDIEACVVAGLDQAERQAPGDLEAHPRALTLAGFGLRIGEPAAREIEAVERTALEGLGYRCLHLDIVD